MAKTKTTAAAEEPQIEETLVASSFLTLYPEQVVVRKGFNVRYDMGDMKALQDSIAANGVKLPITVRKLDGQVTADNYQVYELVDGHRRYQAVLKQLDKQGNYDNLMIPAHEIDAETSEIELLVHMLTTGANNQPLTILERAEGIARMRSENPKIKDAEIARKLGVSQSHVADCTLLMTATPETLTKVKKGQITASAALQFLKATDADEVDTHLEKAVESAKAKGKSAVTKKDVEAAAGKSLTKKGAASRSTKEGAKETNGPVERVPKGAEVINKLIGLEQALLDQEDTKDSQNPVAFATLRATILFLTGKLEPVQMAEIFFGDGEDLPVLDYEEAEEEAPAPKAEKAAPAKKSPAAKPKINLKEAFAEIDEEEKPKKSAKKSAAPAASTKKAVAPKKQVADDFEDEEDDFDADEAEVEAKVVTKAGKKAPVVVEEEDEDDLEDFE